MDRSLMWEVQQRMKGQLRLEEDPANVGGGREKEGPEERPTHGERSGLCTAPTLDFKHFGLMSKASPLDSFGRGGRVCKCVHAKYC